VADGLSLPRDPAEADRESKRWIEELRGPDREVAIGRLHTRLSSVARGEAVRRRGRLPISGPELDDIVTQAADDATLAVLERLDLFRGESRFTTWAAKFAIFEFSRKAARHLWRADGVHLDPDAWERLPDRFSLGPGMETETRELLLAMRRAVENELSDHQRRIFEAVVVNQVPLDVLVIELDTNRNAIYKTMFDARRKLRATLVVEGLIDP
jgi:RNA polymerase sigma-70 factor, ECF subfamily